MRKRILSVFLALAFCLTVLPMGVWAADDAVMTTALTAATSFAGGSGTETNPYRIATAEQLKKLAEDVNGGTTYENTYFKLTADIDLNGSDENPWTPIGDNSSYSARFSGTFDGGGHLVSGLYINNTDSSYQGLFGYSYKGTVKNLGVNGSVIGKDNVGGVVGFSGISSIVRNCYNIGNVTGNNNVGGVVGSTATFGIMENCYNIGNVSGTANYCYVGGVVGNTGSSSIVQSCYNIGNVGGTADNCYVGGVVGYNNSTVKNCYNIGNLSGTGRVGGVVGISHDYSTCTVDNCFFLQGIASSGVGNNNYQGSVKSKTAEEIQTLTDTLNTGDYAGTWKYHDLLKRPVLVDVTTVTLIDETVPVGDTEAVTLEDFRDYINGTGNFDGTPHTGEGDYFMLTKDVVLGGNESNQWTRIGDSRDYPFSGTFDGGGHLIRGLYINRKSWSHEGLFGRVSNGTIKNLGVDGSVTSTSSYVGGVVGYMSGSSTVQNCYNTGDVSGDQEVGGVVGYCLDSSTVQNCYNTGTVNGSSYVGGVVGNNGSTVQNCYNIGDVIGGVSVTNMYVGGVVGYNNGRIQNCYNKGGVSGNREVGGVAGSNHGTIKNCYNTGTVSGNLYVGGIAGYNGYTIQNCYNTGNVIGTYSVGGISVGSNSPLNCYYLEGTAEYGIGYGDEDGGWDYEYRAESKDEDEFKSGEVAWLLQNDPYWQRGQDGQVWYQKIGSEDYPVFEPADDSSIVYRVAFISGVDEYDRQLVFDAYYGNTGFTVSSAPSDKPEREGYEFVRWTTDKEQTGEEYEFKSVTVNSEDVEIYAVWRETFGANDGDITITADYGEGIEENLSELLDEYIEYADGTSSSGNFDYSIKEDNGKLGATVKNNVLIVPSTAKAGTYELVILATEKQAQIAPISVSYGTEPVELIVTVIIKKLNQDAPDVNIEVKKSDSSITITAPDNTDGEYQFSKDGGKTWQDSNEFIDLEPGETYEITVRFKESDNYEASDGCTPKEVTTVDEDGSTTLKDGETIETADGGTITNDGTDVTITDGDGNTTTVTTPNGEDIDANTDGNVNAPEDSKVKRSGAPEMTLPDGGVVGSDGSVTVPEDGRVQIGSTVDIVPPAGEAVKPNDENSVVVPDGSLVTPPNGPQIEIGDNNDETIVDVDGNITFPNGGNVEIGDTVVTVPEGGTLEPQNDGTVYVPEGTKVTGEDGYESTAPEGGAIYDPTTGKLKLAHTVKFNSQGGSEVSDEKVADGEPATKPDDPTRSGYTFGGWFTDADCTEEYDFTKPVTSDIELFAKWTEKVYTVTIEYEDENGETVTEKKEAAYGETTYGDLLPELANKPGYIFEGWCDENGEPVDSDALVDENCKLHPVWTKCEHTGESWSEWTSDDDETHSHISEDCGETATEPHNWDEGEVTKEATETEDGEMIYTCTVCGHTKTDVITAAGSGKPDDPTDEPSSGNINVGSASGENAPSVSMDSETSEKLKAEIIEDHLTDEEKQAVENGDNLDVILQVEDAGDTVSDEDKQAVEEIISDSEYTVGQYINIDLIKLINGIQVDKITELNSPISVTVEIPESLKNDNRIYAIVRVHNRVAEILEDIDDAPDTITILTDKFSTYAIVYQNSDAPEDNDPPYTGNTMPEIAVIALAFAASITAVTTKKKRAR